MRQLLIGVLVVVAVSARDAAAEKCNANDVAGCIASCEANDADSCGVLATLYTDGRGVPVDHAKAAQLAKDSCLEGSQRGCMALGVLYETGRGVAKDEAKAFSMYERSCNTDKFLYGCFRLASAYMAGHGVKADRTKALEILTMACKGGESSSCLNVALQEKDAAKRASLLEKPCNLGSGTACSNLASLYESGTGVSRDLVAARRFYTKACDNLLWAACTRLATMHANGEGGPKDARQAAALYKRACDRGDKPACAAMSGSTVATASSPSACDALAGAAKATCQNDLGNKYNPQTPEAGVKKDGAIAIGLYEKACTGGEPAGCVNFGSELYAGIHVPRDVPRGLVLVHDACKRKFAPACDYLRKQPAWAQGDPAKLVAWQTDGPLGEPEGCRSFWVALEAQEPTLPDDPSIKKLSEQQLAKLAKLKRPATLNDRLWKACADALAAKIRAERDTLDAPVDDGVKRTGSMQNYGGGKQSDADKEKRAKDKAKSKEMSCKVECAQLCRTRSPGDDCAKSKDKCKKGCER